MAVLRLGGTFARASQHHSTSGTPMTWNKKYATNVRDFRKALDQLPAEIAEQDAGYTTPADDAWIHSHQRTVRAAIVCATAMVTDRLDTDRVDASFTGSGKPDTINLTVQVRAATQEEIDADLARVAAAEKAKHEADAAADAAAVAEREKAEQALADDAAKDAAAPPATIGDSAE